MPNVTMKAPTGIGGQVLGTSSGTPYQVDANGQVSVVQADIPQFANLGFIPLTGLVTTQTQAADGLPQTPLSFTTFKNADGTTLAATASAAKFGLANTVGTSIGLVGEAANSNTKTDDAIVEVMMPPWYIAGQNFSVIVNAQIAGAGTPGTHTLQVKAYKMSTLGAASANLGPVAQTITPAGADLTFTVTGTTLSPGDRVLLDLAAVIQETAATNINAQINSVRIG